MINNLLLAVAEALDKEYEYEIYTDAVKQGFKEPCFFIEVINSNKTRINNGRQKKSVNLCIHYFPDDIPDMSINILLVADRLYSLIEVIEGSQRKYRCRNMSHTADSNILHFMFTVDYHVCEKDDKGEYMESLKHDIKLLWEE